MRAADAVAGWISKRLIIAAAIWLLYELAHAWARYPAWEGFLH